MKLRLITPFLLFPLTLLAADFAVVREGRIAARIVNAQPESPVISYAARELQEALQQMAEGEATIATLSEKGDGGKSRMVIGAHAALPGEVRAALKLTSGNEEEVLIQEHDGTLWITGPTERAALYATYTLLDEAGGVRWLWPGEDGTRIPRRKQLLVKETIRQVPDMPYRNLAISGKQDYDEELYTWMARNRLNLANISAWRPDETRATIPHLKEKGYLLRMSGHSVVLPRELLEKHPEYMALYSGERRVFHHRGAHLCWSNPEVQKALCAELIKWTDLFPEMDIASLYTADHYYYCQCEACVAMAPDVSTRWHKLSKILLKAMREHRPDLKYWTLAYHGYRPAPTEAAPYDMVQYAIYDASYRRLLSSGSLENARELAAIRRWKESGATVGLRQYEMIALKSPRAFMPLVSYMVDQFAYAKANDLPSYSSEILPIVYPDDVPPEERNWNTNRMNVYAAVRAMWNASLTSQEVVSDWAGSAYHDAAPAMKKYYDIMEAAWLASPQPITKYFNPSSSQLPGFISPALIGRAEAALAEAWEAARKMADRRDREAAFAAIEMDERMFGVWRQLYRNETPEGDPGIYRLLPYRKGAQAWSVAPEVALHDTQRQATGATARMLWDDGALRVQWKPAGAITIRLRSIDRLGEALEVAVNEKGETGATRFRWDRPEPASLASEVVTHDDGTQEVIIRSEEATKTLATFGRLYVTLETGQARWPVAPLAHGALLKTERPTPRLAFVDVRPDARSTAHPVVRLNGWESHRTTSDLGAVLPQADFTFLNYEDGKNFHLSAEAVREELKPYLDRGGIVMIYATAAVPLDQWLEDKELAFHRVGDKPAEVLRRVTTTTRAGDWVETPNNLSFWKSGTTPYFGFAPVTPGRWRSYATISMKDGREVPWLMATQVGEGWVVVTSEPMSYGGRMSIFGNLFAERVGPFVENLIRDLKR